LSLMGLHSVSISANLLRMPEEILSRAYRISDRRAAAALADPLRRRVVLLLALRDRSVTELASAVGVELKRLHYHVESLRRIGLLTVTSERARAGRPIKRYRAVADTFFVPVESMDVTPGARLAEELRGALARLTDASQEGVLYQVSSKGEFLMRLIQGPRSKSIPMAERWLVLKLSRLEAQRLAKEVEQWLQAAAERSRGSSESYLVHFALAPRKER
jgi:DNA-binding transcriptional ArsR family regulator